MRTFAFAVMALALAPYRAYATQDGFEFHDAGEDGFEFSDENANELGNSVDSRTFFNTALGNYLIEKVQGVKPKETLNRGTVEMEGAEAVLTFPYCPPTGGCDPGYVFFGYDKTRVFKKSLANQGVRHTLLVADGPLTLKYTWENVSGRIVFQNHQYVAGTGGQPFVLEYVMHKLNH